MEFLNTKLNFFERSFSFDKSELKLLNICPICKTNQYLRVFHSFGAFIFCSQCNISSKFIEGSDYQREESYAINNWNMETKLYLQDNDLKS